MSEVFGPVYSRKDYAGFIRRTLALMIDFVLVAIPWIAVPWLWYSLAPPTWVTLRSYGWIYLALLVESLTYLLGMRLTTRGTLGYRAMGIRYASMLDEPPGVGILLFRALAALALMWIFALDHLWILFDEHKQAWHDKLTGFYVIKNEAQPVARRRVHRRIIGFMGWCFLVWEPADPDNDSSATSGPAAGKTDLPTHSASMTPGDVP